MFPVHKKGDKNLVENYRGITTLPTGVKFFEVVVQNSLDSFSDYKRPTNFCW